MRIKRILSFITALSLAVSAVSCGNDTKEPLRSGDLTTESGIRNTSWKKNPSGYDTITVFYDETKVCDEDLTGAYPVAVSEDKIYYVSYGYNEEDKWNGYIADLSGGAIQADEHDDIAAAAMIYRDDKRIVYCGMDDDDDGSIVSLDLSNGNTVYAETGYVRYAVSDPSGNIYVINELFKLKYFDSSLNLVKEYDLSEQMKNDFSERFMYDMCVSDDGKVYFVISEKYVCHNIYTVNEEGKLIDITGEITDLDGCVNRLFTNSDGNLVLATGYGTVLTDVIDPETGNVLYMYENYGADELIGTSEKYDLIYTMADGIYGYNYKEDSEELIVSEDVIPHVSSSYASSFMQGDKLYMSLAEPVPPSLYVVDRKTGETSKSEFPGCDCACVGPDGKLYYISSEFQLKSSDDGYTYETVLCSVYRHDDDGNDTLLFNLPELEFESQTADLVINSEGDLIVLYDDEDGNRYLMIYDNSGNLKSTVYPEDFTEYDISLFLNEVKNVYLAIADVIENKTHIYSLDSQNNELKEAGSLDVSSTQRIQNGNSGYDLYYTDLAGIMGWKAESGTTEKVIQLADIDGSLYNGNIVYSRPLIMNTSELACANGIKLVKADEERLAELNSREVLTLAVSGTEPINRYVSKFNRESDSCHILLKDYRRNGNPFDYSDGKAEMDDLAKDIIDNNIPDIIMLDYMDLSSYITKDFFADLKEIADNDPEFDLSDIYQNVQDAFTFNNCLYTIPGSISQSTLTAAEKIQSMDYRTLADSMDFCKEDVCYFASDPYDIILSYINDHVDMNNKKCDFDNDIFISLLEGFQNKKEYSLDEEGSETEDENSHRFRNVNIDSLDSFLWSTGGTRESYSTAYVTGWPSENGGKKIIHPGYSFGITKNTEHKDSAWEFIKFILNSGDSDLNEDFGDGFSMEGISKSVSEKKIDEFLNEIASLNEYSCSEDDLKAYRECLEMPACSDMIYQGVIGIISEEIVHIYEDRTAEEVAKSIQNKVTLYLNEIS